MKKLVIGAAAGALLIAVAAAGDARAQVAAGSYTFEMEGLVSFFGGFPVRLPTYSVATFESDGANQLTDIDGVLNIGGCVIIKQAGSGTIDTTPQNGRGTATVNLIATTTTPTGVAGCPNLSSLPQNLTFNFEFAGTTNGEEGALVGVSVTNSAGTPVLAWGGIGSTRLRGTSSPTMPAP